MKEKILPDSWWIGDNYAFSVLKVGEENVFVRAFNLSAERDWSGTTSFAKRRFGQTFKPASTNPRAVIKAIFGDSK
jgi:hypothetical protein